MKKTTQALEPVFPQAERLESIADDIETAQNMLLAVLDFIDSECPNEYNCKPITVAPLVFPKLNRYRSVLSSAIHNINGVKSQLYSMADEEAQA